MRRTQAFIARVQVTPAPERATSPQDDLWRIRPDKAWVCPACRVRWPSRVDVCPRCEGTCLPMAGARVATEASA